MEGKIHKVELLGQVEETDENLDLELLAAPSQILFFDKLEFYEDELGDHGISFLDVRVV